MKLNAYNLIAKSRQHYQDLQIETVSACLKEKTMIKKCLDLTGYKDEDRMRETMYSWLSAGKDQYKVVYMRECDPLNNI